MAQIYNVSKKKKFFFNLNRAFRKVIRYFSLNERRMYKAEEFKNGNSHTLYVTPFSSGIIS